MNRHTLLPLAVSILALTFLDPFAWFQGGVELLLLGGLILATTSYALFIFTERADDEREVSIRAFADRFSCLAGMALLVMVIGYRLLVDGYVYPEIILVLVLMVTTKSVAHWYACKNL